MKKGKRSRKNSNSLFHSSLDSALVLAVLVLLILVLILIVLILVLVLVLVLVLIVVLVLLILIAVFHFAYLLVFLMGYAVSMRKNQAPIQSKRYLFLISSKTR